MKIILLLAALLGIATPCLAGGFSGDGFGSRGFFQYVKGATSGAMTTPVLASFSGPTSGVSNFLSPPVGAFTNPTLTGTVNIRYVPIPMAGTIKNLYATLTGANTSASIVDGIGPAGTAGTVTCNFSAAIFCSDSTHSDHLAAGTTLEWAENSGGGTWTGSPNIITISWDYLGDNAQQSMLLSGPSNTSITGTTTAAWAGFGTANIGTNAGTEVDVSSVMPGAGQVTGFYIWANAFENSTAAHVYTVYHNGSAMGTVTCTPALSTAGCCVNTDASPGTVNGSIACTTITCTTACHFNAGDTLSWEAACAAANCATVIPGASVRFTPDVANQAFLLAQNQTAMPTGHFMGLEDVGNSAGSGNFQTAPVGGMTLSNLIACNTSLTGSGSATFATKLATTPATAPTTAAGPSATVSSSTLCPGSAVAGLTNGFQDTTSVSVGGGYSLVNAYTISGSPTITSFWKTGMVATVP